MSSLPSAPTSPTTALAALNVGMANALSASDDTPASPKFADLPRPDPQQSQQQASAHTASRHTPLPSPPSSLPAVSASPLAQQLPDEDGDVPMPLAYDLPLTPYAPAADDALPLAGSAADLLMLDSFGDATSVYLTDAASEAEDDESNTAAAATAPPPPLPLVSLTDAAPEDVAFLPTLPDSFTLHAPVSPTSPTSAPAFDPLKPLAGLELETHVTSAHAQALITLAEAYLYGLDNRPCDHGVAFNLLVEACTLGSAKAAGLVGFCHEFGLGTPQSFQRCEDYYLRAAKRGHAVSMARLSFLRRYGRPNVRMNRAEAEEWQLRVAALVHHAPLVCNATRSAMAVPPNAMPLAWLWWAAVDMNDAAAQYSIGTCYHDGVGVEKSPTNAVRWYRMSAKQGHPRGEGIMGYCHGEGFGTEKNPQLALEYYLKAAHKGETVAMYNVGYCYEEGIGVPERDLAVAFLWYERAAERGNALAANSLGYFYEEGLGMPSGQRDLARAVHWYRVAAEQGNPWAEHNLAYMYASGLGVTKDERKAFKWYARAAMQGHAGAQNKLAHCYQVGQGTEQDPMRAVAWYAKAAAQHYPAACVALAWCFENGIGTLISARKALHWVDVAIAQGYTDHVVSDWSVALGLKVSLEHVGECARDAAAFAAPAIAA